MYIIYNSDAWHTHESKRQIAIAIDENMILPLINQYIDKHNDEPLSDDDIFNLDNIKQTQNYKGEGEFMVEEVEEENYLI